jgi:hypothetical protein
MTSTNRPWRHITQGASPGQPQRFGAIVEHLTRDHERGTLTLKGPDLAYYTAFAKPGDPVRDWVMAQLDSRIAASDARRLIGARAADPHVCQQCLGRGCAACGDVGMVCPTCHGHRWLTDGNPVVHGGRAPLTACPGCMASGPNGFAYSASIEARTIQRHLDRHRVA